MFETVRFMMKVKKRRFANAFSPTLQIVILSNDGLDL